ncbi:helix-turn-helix domain-containing protein [uncultured Tenacibaculum sp.]|uniref:helix-turn-helix domain-containing protein n=1 Tax=uncultured Tenacibaculum sp. TaxID=174713 RepID=UPI002617987C|nr:helix-turn-helix domain-containing protein [uncultured Tenacibaculum sp.]
MFQKVFLEKVEKMLPENNSLNEAVAMALEISYDAAHRRTSLKSKFSLEESIKLARYFNLSLDELFGLTEKQFVSVEKTKEITNEVELQQYFENAYKSLLPLLNKKGCQIYYSAKDIPIFYTLSNNRLSQFKFYVWLKLLDKQFRDKSFDEYYPKLSTIKSAKKLGELYQDLTTIEIWDITTINSTLKQIHFYYKAGQLKVETAMQLCMELKELLNEISLKVVAKKQRFKLYYNELLIMNNNIFISTPERESLYVPFLMLSYYQTSDKRVCSQAKKFFNKQLKNSKLLNTSGEKEQNTFYNKMMGKVNALEQLIRAENILEFE